MPHTLTDVETFTAGVSVPNPGDEVDASSVEPGFQALANRTRYLYEHDQGRAIHFFAEDVNTATFTTTSYLAASGGDFGVSIDGVEVGDVLLVFGGGNATLNSMSDNGALLGLFATDRVGGGGSETLITGTERAIQQNTTADTRYESVSWAGCLWVVQSADGTGTRIRVKGKVIDADDGLALVGGGNLTVIRMRGVVPVED